jgi:stage II sporulation protein D
MWPSTNPKPCAPAAGRALWALALAAAMLSRPALAMSQRASEAGMYSEAVSQYQAGNFDEAGAAFKALARRNPLGRRAWMAFLFERQGYSELEIELSGTADAEERLWLARARADNGQWSAALPALEGLEGREAALLRAEALDAIGSTAAGQAWGQALQSDKRNPMAAFAAFKAADFAGRQDDFAQAEKLYKRAERLDPSYGAVHGRLAQLYAQDGRYADAKARLERALKVDSQDAQALDCLNLLKKAEPGLFVASVATAQRLDLARLKGRNPRVTPLRQKEGEPMMRIGILEGASRFSFRTGSATCLEPMGLTLEADALYQMEEKGGHWRLWQRSAQGLGAVADLEGASITLAQEDPSSTISVFDVAFGSGYFWAAKEDRSYRDSLEISFDQAGGLTVVNVLPLDAYLLGVLPAEMPQSWPREALLAQAVAARSDALSKRGRHKAQGFDLCSEVHCQMYRGVGEESPATTFAVTATAGEVLESGGKLLGGIYMNSCGGHTQDSWDAWAGEATGQSHAVFDGPSPKAGAFPLAPQDLLGYLEDPRDQVGAWCSRMPGELYSDFRWVARYSRQELEATVARRHEVGRLLAVEPLERSEAGYVRRVRFIGTKGSSIGSSDYIRSAIKGLRSNLFYVETRRDADGDPVEFLFHGGGWGHGVGFCQSGAGAMALAGRKHGEILRHYFTGSGIKRLY